LAAAQEPSQQKIRAYLSKEECRRPENMKDQNEIGYVHRNGMEQKRSKHTEKIDRKQSRDDNQNS
jgi:hypothetical protein